MKRTIRLAAAATALVLLIGAAAPAVGGPTSSVVPFVAEEAAAQAGPKGGSGGSRTENVGGNAAELLQGWIGPLLLIFIGILAFAALISRNVGMAVSVTIIGLIAGLFVFSPESAEDLFTGIYDAVFG